MQPTVQRAKTLAHKSNDRKNVRKIFEDYRISLLRASLG